jgi:aspartate racemase
MRLYQPRLKARGFDCLVPTEEEMDRIVMPSIDLVKANRVAESYAPLAEIARRLIERGARAVVLGCTENPLGIAAGPALPFPVADTIDALARASIAWAKPAG